MFDIDLQSRVPIYEQLYKKIVELVVNHILKQGDQLPSVREMAKNLGVNPNTISKAYNELERDGVIFSLAGRGSFVGNIDTDIVKEKALAHFDEAVSEALVFGATRQSLCDRIMEAEKK